MIWSSIRSLSAFAQKIAALDQAAPLAGWELPDAFPTLRRHLEARMGKSGKREYVISCGFGPAISKRFTAR